jgi:hypothetical protein
VLLSDPLDGGGAAVSSDEPVDGVGDRGSSAAWDLPAPRWSQSTTTKCALEAGEHEARERQPALDRPALEVQQHRLSSLWPRIEIHWSPPGSWTLSRVATLFGPAIAGVEPGGRSRPRCAATTSAARTVTVRLA